jgi:hypothetical protein
VNTSHFWRYFFWLLMQGLSFVQLRMVTLICILLTGCLVGLVTLQRPFQSARWKPYYWLVLTQFLSLPGAAAIGALFRAATNPPFSPQVNPLGETILDSLGILSLAVSVFWIYRMKGFRWFAFCLLGLQTVLLFGVMFVAAMSVTGDWL